MKKNMHAVRRPLLISISTSIVMVCSAAAPLSAAVDPVVPNATESRAEQQFRKGLSLAEANNASVSVGFACG